jgi:glutamate-1-semialdehyde aminotransferase
MITSNNYQKSEEYRRVIHGLIPGGAHTYSKGDDQFPEVSPAAIDYGKGAYVWDIDGNKFLDCSMGLTSVSLGHAYEPVLEKVREELLKGVNFQRPSSIERVMAERFLALVPQHDMIKFAKNGSAVTTAAVKLARAYTGRELVAYPAEHPFYSFDDWFIGATGCNKGIPSSIQDLTKSFKANDINSLKALFDEFPNKIACIISEPEKSTDTHDIGAFLREAIELCHANGALFILDEMVTGFKTGFPGSISKYNIKPDLATWGKGIANGFSFCALTGTKEIMNLGGIKNIGKEKVFLISTTHGGETHAIAAGLASIDAFEKNNVINHLHHIGGYANNGIAALINKRGLENYVKIAKADWMPTLIFLDENSNPNAGFRTLALQEMIKQGVLFQGIISPCYAHSKADIDYFVHALDKSLTVYEKALEDGYQKFLIGEPAKPVFRKIL